MIKYFCSDGSRVSQATIDKRLSESYRKYDDGTVGCRGCGARAEGHAHILSKARCKHLHKTELIWNPENYIKACNNCNRIIEAPTSETFRNLRCYNYCMSILKKYDQERYQKALSSATTN